MVSLHAALAAIALSGVGQTVLLDFYGDRCPPCREMQPAVQSLINAGYPVQRINVEQKQNAALASKYRVSSIPCFVMVVNGVEVSRVVGKTSYERLERMCMAGAPQKNPAMLAQTAPQPVRPVQPVSAVSPAMAAPFDGWANRPAANQPAPPSPAGIANVASDATLLAASVRLRIEDPDGHSCGSGTIIDARNGKALILTCGHIFRDWRGKGKIEVDLFGQGGLQRVTGEVVSYSVPDVNGSEGNSKADIGLVSIQTPVPVTAAPVAPPGYRVSSGMAVASVGCNNGDIPTVRRSKITSLDKFIGAPNVQVAGQPVEGRSGGGLFSSEGYVIGVCNAADPSDKEGLFAALGSIYAELDRAQLAFVYKSPSTVSPAAPEAAAPTAIAANPMPPMPMPQPSSRAGDSVQPTSWNTPVSPAAQPTVALASAASSGATLSANEQAAMDEIHRRRKEGSEVVIIVRPRDNADAKSEVFMLDRASSEFRRQIANEAKPQDKVWQETSLETAKPRRILLEWSIDGRTTGK